MSQPQREFLSCVEAQTHNRIGYGGARSGGKSWGARRAAIGRRMAFPGSRGLILRRTYDEIYGNHILPLIKSLPKDSYHYNASDHRMTFFNGSIQEFGYCRNDIDVLRYHGQEYDDIIVDEAEQWQERWFDELGGSARTTSADIRPLMICSFMPGGIGHGWVKRRFIDKEFLSNENGEEYKFVKATVYDNPIICENDPDYVKTLQALPDELRRAWLEGDFDVFAGQFFRDLRRDVHGFTGDPPPGWTFRCMDYGESSPSAVYWCRVDREGDVWVYRELYGAGMNYEDLADRITSMSINVFGRIEEVRYTVAPPDVFGVSKGSSLIGEKVLRDRGIPCIKAINNRIDGWRLFKMYISSQRLHVHLDNCPHFWRTVPMTIYDTHTGEDMDTDCEDHAADSIRYGLMSRPQGDGHFLDDANEDRGTWDKYEEPVSTGHANEFY